MNFVLVFFSYLFPHSLNNLFSFWWLRRKKWLMFVLFTFWIIFLIFLMEAFVKNHWSKNSKNILHLINRWTFFSKKFYCLWLRLIKNWIDWWGNLIVFTDDISVGANKNIPRLWKYTERKHDNVPILEFAKFGR